MTEPIVDIKKLWTVFPNGDKKAVVHKDLDLRVERGEVLSLVGGSGTGKTVLLRQMLGLEKPTQGEITVLGRPAAELGKQGAASRVGMLFQQGALFSAFTVLENIAFPLRELRTLPRALVYEAAMVKLQMVGLGPDAADRRCCCSMSPRPAWTRKAPTVLSRCCDRCTATWISRS
jgi:phospholipid/cholesterol/gamma-HCH transport system ATP-binding protein